MVVQSLTFSFYAMGNKKVHRTRSGVAPKMQKGRRSWQAACHEWRTNGWNSKAFSRRIPWGGPAKWIKSSLLDFLLWTSLIILKWQNTFVNSAWPIGYRENQPEIICGKMFNLGYTWWNAQVCTDSCQVSSQVFLQKKDPFLTFLKLRWMERFTLYTQCEPPPLMTCWLWLVEAGPVFRNA